MCSELRANKNYLLCLIAVYSCLLFGGSSFFIIDQAWIDPIIASIVLLSALSLRKNNLILAGLYSGVAITIKQYAFIAVILLTIFACKKYGIKKAFVFLRTYLIVAGAILLPFVLWNPVKFYESAISGIMQLPPRLDSLSIRSFILLKTGSDLSLISAIAPIAFFLFLASRIWNGIVDLSGVFMHMGFMYFLIFVFSSHAFANYYYLVYLFFFFSVIFSISPSPQEVEIKDQCIS